MLDTLIIIEMLLATTKRRKKLGYKFHMNNGISSNKPSVAYKLQAKKHGVLFEGALIRGGLIMRCSNCSVTTPHPIPPPTPRDARGQGPREE